MLTLNDGRSELWQWDTGRTLAVDADCSQVHFSNKVFGRSIDVDVTDGVAIIPDILLQTDKDLNVWAFVGTAENGYTKISKTFKVNRRNKPADYVFTPTDQMTLQTIQSQIGDLADLTTEAKENLVAAINEAARTGGGGGGSTVELDTTLSEAGKAADAAAVGDRLSALSDEIANLQTSGLTTAQINALDGLFKIATYTEDSSKAYAAFQSAFGLSGGGEEPDVPGKTLTSISAVYSGGSVPTGTAVNDLTGIVVTAHYSDGTSETVTDYTLSGTIAEGENTVTVSYGGKTTTFTVMGIAIDYHVMTVEDASQSSTAQSKTVIRGYNNSAYSNVLVPNVLNELPVKIMTSYPGTANFNVSDNIENLAFEENSTVIGSLEIMGDSLKTIKNFPAGMTGLDTASKSPYAINLESVSGLEKNTALTSLNLGHSALKQPPVLNAGAPITSLNAAFYHCNGMVSDISSWRIPSSVTNIRQLFRYCGGITGNFLVDRNYTADNCKLALNESGVREVTVTDVSFAAPFKLFEEGLTDYTPLNSDAELGSTKQWKFHVPRDSAAFRVFREAYAGIVNGIMKYELAVTDGNAPTKNITFYGDSQLSPFGNVTSQMLQGMSDDVFLWNLAVRGASTASYKPMFAKFPERRSDVTVLWLITNDTGLGADDTMNNIRHYVDSLDTDKYIILGTWFFHYEELKSRNEQLRATYGDHYLDIHKFTLDNWERITGITPTEADLSAVANDTVPPCLIHTDGVHENDAGGLVIATGIKEKLMGLGYIDSTWLK